MSYQEITRRFGPEKDNIIGILHHLQDRNPRHYLPPEDLEWVARYLNTTRGYVYGVVKFYTMFSTRPRGRFLVRVCESPVCNLKENTALLETLKQELDVETGETTADALFTLETCQCLGHCDKAPAMMVNRDIYGNLTPLQVRDIVRNVRKGELG